MCCCHFHCFSVVSCVVSVWSRQCFCSATTERLQCHDTKGCARTLHLFSVRTVPALHSRQGLADSTFSQRREESEGVRSPPTLEYAGYPTESCAANCLIQSAALLVARRERNQGWEVLMSKLAKKRWQHELLSSAAKETSSIKTT